MALARSIRLFFCARILLAALTLALHVLLRFFDPGPLFGPVTFGSPPLLRLAACFGAPFRPAAAVVVTARSLSFRLRSLLFLRIAGAMCRLRSAPYASVKEAWSAGCTSVDSLIFFGRPGPCALPFVARMRHGYSRALLDDEDGPASAPSVDADGSWYVTVGARRDGRRQVRVARFSDLLVSKREQARRAAPTPFLSDEDGPARHLRLEQRLEGLEKLRGRWDGQRQ